MRTYPILTGLLAICCSSVTAQAQLSWVVDSISDTVGNTVMVPVKVNGFTNLVSMQGTINFDPDIISFSSVSLFGLSGLTMGNFGTGDTANGKLTYSWYDGGLTGQSLADSSTVFVVSFDLIGNMGSSSEISFGNDPVLLECVDTGFSTIAATYSTGAVSIVDTSSSVSVTEFPQYHSTTIEAFPNPFVQDLTVTIHAENDSEARLMILNSIGKKVHDDSYQVFSGENTIEIGRDGHHMGNLSSGIYFIKLHVNGGETSYKLIRN